ncbi:glycosyltransferase family 2 protein [Marinilongibacter aquaticus]|uniref:glycosyltransferase family 2 protein n=1 Tax=Marinilongibacter aquaticus TaxID=2975157 RepID=UPI0021BD9B68|nr:glycosyltransferase family 2 protein [Marinilongibacter aquaticus]UBM60724.1 glycosyltransferase family 2 protein [Marinilongibacter aquaticus]
MKLVSIITVNFNAPEETEALIHSIASENTYPLIELIVVDNGSRVDHTPKWIEKYPEVCFLRSEKNLGFAGGNNLGIEIAKGELLFLINNDTEITPKLIPVLVECLEDHPEVGMVSPKINYFEKREIIQYAGFSEMNFFTARNHCIGQYEMDSGQYNTAQGPTGYAHGAAMMLKRECLLAAGPMQSHYFLYYEELDWCERIKKSGYSIWVEPSVTLYHKESISVGKNSPLKSYFMTRNRILFERLHAPSPTTFFIFCLYFAAFALPKTILNHLMAGEYANIKSVFKGVFWHFKHSKDSTDLGYLIK